MVIEKIIIKSFGLINDMTLEFSDKVNVIEGQNESGKSTIAAFIKYMLYGFDEADFDKECDLTVALLAPAEARLARLTVRDNRSAEALRARMAAAPDDSFYSSRASFTVVNDGDAAGLREAAIKIIGSIK